MKRALSTRQILSIASGAVLGLLCSIALIMAITADERPCALHAAIGGVIPLGVCEVESRPCDPDGIIAGKCYLRN